MFLIIPLGLLAISCTAIIWIVGRKFVYLKKLAPEVIEEVTPEERHFLIELFPEVAHFFASINFRGYGVTLLTETEKALRRLRLLGMRIDTVTNKLIHKVRHSTKEHEKILSEREPEKIVVTEPQFPETNVDMKQEEQRLIIEIAKNPKNAELYKELGMLYMKNGDLEDSRESFGKAVELNGEDAESKRRLDRVEKLLEKLEKLPA
jgi:hypothetical protein